MYSHYFIGLFLAGFQLLACFNCAPGRAVLDLPLEEKHTAYNRNILEDAKVKMAKRVAECKDERDCSWIEQELAKYGGNLDEYCDMYKDTGPIKQCRKTCKMCKAPAPLECKDERDCSWIEEELAKYGGNLDEYCDMYKDTGPIKQCRKTCKMCKAPAPPGCKDERQDCDRLIAKTGGGEKLEKYCKKWKDEPAVKQCLATCNMCPEIPSRDLGLATAVASKRLLKAARDSRANLLDKVKKSNSVRRGYPRALPTQRVVS